MNSLQTSMRGALVWIVPFALLALLLLWQTDWGRAFGRAPPAETAIAPQPLSLSLLPEYQPSAPPDSTRDAVERTLFNPTRRPAPTAVADAAKPKLQRGQFTLSGTLVVDGKATAFLREVNGGKSRRVAQGETVNGMVITDIRPDRVRLTVGDESEDLILKVAAGPKTTIQPAAPGPVAASAAPAPMPPAPATAQARDVSEILAERRRVARAQELAAQGLPPGSPLPQVLPSAPVTGNVPPPPAGNLNSGDPGWQAVYQRMQQPRGR